MKIVFIISFVITCLACHKSSGVNNDPFVSVPVKVELRDLINEASGIADSEKNPGNLWVEEDSGNPPQLILLGHDGTIRKKIPLKGATNRDWEDVALSAVPGRQGSFLFIAETGDNGQLFPNYLIYRFPEPFL
ncbi:MAG TPA: hypothetical protein VM012_15680, partial [Flavitalea sp.]|nr:hypothetical protein [Flavitalea sp.]